MRPQGVWILPLEFIISMVVYWPSMPTSTEFQIEVVPYHEYIAMLY